MSTLSEGEVQMLETVNSLANALVAKAPQLLRVAFNEENRTRDLQPEAAHFLKFNLNGDERRMGRDFEIYNFMSSIEGEPSVTAYLLEELVFPLKGYSVEAFTEGITFLRGRASIFGEKQQQWLDLLADLEK